MNVRDKCDDDGAAPPTVHTGLPSGRARTTLAKKNVARIDKIIMMLDQMKKTQTCYVAFFQNDYHM
jgi:hypothetical protein